MAEQSGFFDANLINGEYDRVYLAEHFAKYFSSFIGNGIFGGKSNELMVSQASASGMRIEVLSGMGYINGYWYENTSNLSLNVDVADGVLNRIDNVVLQWNRADRKIKAVVKKGVFATNPVSPVIQRDNDVYELKLAEVYVGAGAVNITQGEITDTRLDSDVCGFVVALIKQFDTTEFGAQLNSYISNYAAQYKEYIENLKSQGATELEGLVESLNAIVKDESAFASLVLKTNDVAEETALVSQTLGYTKKNLIPYPYAVTSNVSNGITWTDNGDGTITANGTATVADSYFLIYQGEMLKPGKYTISSGIEDSAEVYVYARRLNKVTNEREGDVYRSLDNTATFEIKEGESDTYYLYVNAYIMLGTTVTILTFKPMIRRAEILNDVWEPYKLSVAEMIQEDELEKGCFYRINRFNGRKEWINPACAPGWEYPLVERWNSQPVYQVTIYAASLPNASAMVLETNAEWDRLISVSGYAIDKDDLTLYPFPVILHGQVTPIAVISRIESDGSLIITTSGDASYLEAYVTIKYTKSY